MSFDKAITLLHKIRVYVEENKAISHEDVSNILEFIEPYVRANNSVFLIFRELLNKYYSTCKAPDEKPQSLICAIDAVLKFLETEDKVEKALLQISTIAIVFVIGYFIFV